MTSVPDHILMQVAQAEAIAHLTSEERLLARIGFQRRAIAVARAIADRRATTIAEELIRLGYLRPDVWWEMVARDLGLRHFRDLYLAAHRIDAFLPDARFFQNVRQAWHWKSNAAILVIAPRGIGIDRLKRDIEHDPTMRRRFAIAAPWTIRRAVQRSFEPALTHQAIHHLQTERPAMSAANGAALTRRLIVCFMAILAIAAAAPATMLATFGLLFLLAGLLRLGAVLDKPDIPAITPLPDAKLPTYSVLVPLFRETKVIGDLIRAIARIDYPADRLNVHLVVEADDRETVEAAVLATAGTRIRIIAVPPSKPRTKPKALVWALPFVDGELLTIFDAEDRPAPDQLRKAAAAFAAAPPDLVCLQAMLDIDHTGSSINWLSRQFALEYRVLFRSLLPWLARKQMFLPIGGTSNHFRRDALVRIGAWDPFNVTEDADLSVRIMRAGYRIDTLDSITSEEAPLSWRAWHLQRTRWMKGWLQTWLVHTRHPLQLLRDVGIWNFVAFQVLILGQIVSALVYPIGVILIALDLIGLIPLFADRSFADDLLLAFQLLAFGCGWLGVAAALMATTDKNCRMVRRSDLLTVPIYWFLLFGAVISAIAELIVDPHRWNKTGHGIAERSDDRKSVRFPPRVPGSSPPSPKRPPLPRPQLQRPPPPRPRSDR